MLNEFIEASPFLRELTWEADPVFLQYGVVSYSCTLVEDLIPICIEAYVNVHVQQVEVVIINYATDQEVEITNILTNPAELRRVFAEVGVPAEAMEVIDV